MSVDKKHIQRVTEEKASKLFHEGWRYVSKSVWKEKVRDVDKKIQKSPVGVNPTHKDTKKKANEMSAAVKRHLKKSNK